MSQFRNMLAQSRKGLAAGEQVTKKTIASLARKMDVSCVSDAIVFLDELAIERNQLEQQSAWDGDASDDIYFQQQSVATLLALGKQLPPFEIAKGLKSDYADTRFWLAYALLKSGDKTVVQALQNALEHECEDQNIDIMNQAITACSQNWIMRKIKKLVG